MVSRASSRTRAARGHAEIPSLPRLGTTWYERGPRYWLRRARIDLGLLVAAALMVYFALMLYGGFTDEWSPTARTVSYWVQAAGSIVTVVWGWSAQRRDHRAALLDPPSPGESRAAMDAHKSRAAGLSVTGRGLMVVLAPVVPVAAAWGVGWLFAYATVREYPSEVGARRWLEKHSTAS